MKIDGEEQGMRMKESGRGRKEKTKKKRMMMVEEEEWK